jgi:hypothetical protein
MNIKNTIIEHYRKFFDLHAKGIALDEDDHLNIDWAEDLVKNCFIPNVVLQSEQLNKNKTITLPKVEPSKVMKSNEGVD